MPVWLAGAAAASGCRGRADRRRARLPGVAPTVGGKTEAALLPAPSRVLAEDTHGLSGPYLCQIKALVSNMEPRPACYA